MLKMLINVTTEHQNSTACYSGSFGPILFQWVLPSLGSRYLVSLVGAGLSKNHLHWRQFIIWPKDNSVRPIGNKVHILFSALTLGILGKYYNLCVKCYWWWCFLSTFTSRVIYLQVCKNTSTPYCTLVWKEKSILYSLLSHRSLWKIKENQSI